jgi:hypothetical protein
MCLLCGTDWFLIWSRLRFVFKRLIHVFPQKNYYVFVIIPIRVTHPAYLLFLDLSILKIFGKEYIYEVPTVQISSVSFYFTHPTFINLLSTLLYSLAKMKDKHSCPHPKAKITGLYILIFTDIWEWKEKYCETNGSKHCPNLMFP